MEIDIQNVPIYATNEVFFAHHFVTGAQGNRKVKVFV